MRRMTGRKEEKANEEKDGEGERGVVMRRMEKTEGERRGSEEVDGEE